MGRNALLPILLLLLIVFDGCNVCLGWELRKLLGDNESAITDPSTPAPIPGDVTANPKETSPSSDIDAQKGKPEGLNHAISPAPRPSPKTDSRTINPSGSDDKSPAGPPTVPKIHNDKSDKKEYNMSNEEKGDRENSPEKENRKPNEGKGDDKKSSEQENSKNNEGKTFSQSRTNESCGALRTNCTDGGKMLACISQSGSKGVVVLVQNGGDSPIKVKLFIEEKNIGDIEVPKNETDKINIPTSGNTKVTLNAGTVECVLQFNSGTPVTEGNLFLHLPSYDKLLTPVNGAYFIIISVIIFGGAWACCKLGKRKRHDGVPYQELEMALPESVAATDVETAEGWDQGWDDDWDDDMEPKSSVKRHVGSISANGLTSRSSNHDGWEDNWDD